MADPIKLEIDATDFEMQLSHRIRYYHDQMASKKPIPMHEMFDTEAFSPTNQAGREILWKQREDLTPAEGNTWKSKAGFVNLMLRYKLWQSSLPIRIDTTLKGDFIIEAIQDVANYTINLEVKSPVLVAIRDSFTIGGETITIKDTLYMSSLYVSATEINYSFHRKGEPTPFLLIHNIYDSQSVDKSLKERGFSLSVGPNSTVLTRLQVVAAKSLLKGGCNTNPGGDPDKEHSLWLRGNQPGICYTAPGCGANQNPRSPGDINLGCYPNRDAANRAWNTHPSCNLPE